MERLDEHEVAQNYIGKPVNPEKFAEVFEADGDDNYASDCEYLDDELCDKFHITDALCFKWTFHHVDFKIKVSLENGKIAGCSISKLEEGYGYFCNGRPQEHWDEVSPTQHEIRIFRRIMDYVVQGQMK